MSYTLNHHQTATQFDMPEFDGARDPEVFLDWLRAIERIFDYKNYDERKRCKLAVHQFTKRAYSWYEKLKAKRRKEGKEKIRSWTKLKKHLKRKFLPINYEQEKLFLDTRDPPKPPMIKKSDPLENILAYIEKIKEDLRKEEQEAEDIATRAQQEDELVCEFKPTQVMSISREISHVQEEHQPMDETPQLVLMKLPTEPQIKAIHEESKQPLVLDNKTDLNVLSIETQEDDKDGNKQETFEESTNMLSVSLARKEEEEQPMVEAIQRDIMKSSITPQIKRKQPLNSYDQIKLLTVLRMHDVLNQEREDRVQRKHDDAQGTKQQTYTRSLYLESLYREYVYSFFIVLIDQNVHARSGLQLLLYDLRFEVESLQERECDAGARGPNAYPRPSHVYPSSLGSKQASIVGSTSKTVIKNLFLDLIGLDYKILKRRDDKAHEVRTNMMSRGQGNMKSPC